MINGTNNPFSCSPVVFSASNTIISLGTISRVGNVFTFSVGFVWRINGTIYQNSAPISLTITEAADGFNRIDNAILNASNSIELQQGLESSAVALQPIVPETNILLTSWNIYGDAIDDQLTPNLGNNFLQKEYEKSQVVNTSGNAVVIPLNIKGRNNIILNGALTGVVGFSFSNLDANPTYAEYPHEGKDYYIQNKTGHEVTLKNFDGTVDIEMLFLSKDGNDIVVPNNGIVSFKKSLNILQEIFRSYDSFDISQKADLVAGKVPASQLPSYVDDVLEFANLTSLPTTGEAGKIYVTTDANKQYRWGGTAYVEISASTAVWGSISGTIANQTDLMYMLSLKQNTISATANRLLRFTPGGIVSSIIHDDGTNVGIGTTSPNRTLTIGGTSSAIMSFNASSNRNTTIGSDSVGNFIVYDDTDGSYRMVIKSSGNVGIGTSSPSGKFEIDASGSFNWGFPSTAVAKIGTKGTGGSLLVSTPSLNSSYESGFAVDGTYTSGKSVINLTAFGVLSDGPYGADFAFRTTDQSVLSEKMRITSAGNVGIGTTTPNASAILDLTSTSKGFLPPRMNNADRDNMASTAIGLIIYNTSSDTLDVFTSVGWKQITGL